MTLEVFPLLSGIAMSGYLKLYWLIFVFLLLLIVYQLWLKLIKRIKSPRTRSIAAACFLLVMVFIAGISLKLLVLDIYKIPSGSMQDSLFPDDVILVNKLTYGPKLPQNPFEISWINILFSFSKSARAAMAEEWWPYRRLKGYDTVTRGDVCVYQLFQNFFVAKRCLGIPGDTLSIYNGSVYLNHNKYRDPATVKNNYRINVNNIIEFHKRIDAWGKDWVVKRDMLSKDLIGSFSYSSIAEIKKIPEVNEVQLFLDEYAPDKATYFNSDTKKWTYDNFGPLIVPKKGMRIRLNPETYELYKKTLQEHEKVDVSEKAGIYYINHVKAGHFVFTKDYYFVMGDNRKASEDSRRFGFIPEKAIVGKVQCVLYSRYKDKFRWERIFKSI